MQTTNFSPTAAIKFGWETFKKNKKFWVIATILMFLVGGGGRSLNLGNNSSSDKNETNIQQNVEYNSTNEIAPYNKVIMEEQDKSIPFVPKQVDSVLGISDQRKNGNMVGFVILIVIVVIALVLPYLVVSILVGGAVQMGVVKFFLAAARGQDTKYELFLSEIKLNKAWRFLAASFLYVLLVFVGLVFFIIPGIYFALKYRFVTYIIVDKDVSIGEAFSLSGKYTKGHKWQLIGLGFLTLFINILGVLALLYGLLVSIPVSLLAAAYAYDRLSKSA